MATKALYLHLYHGFPDAKSREETVDWGQVGPDIGPLIYIHTTYATDIKIGYDPDDFDPHQFFAEQSGLEFYSEMFLLKIVDGCVLLNGVYYGDWSVYVR